VGGVRACVAVCCSELKCVAVHWSRVERKPVLQSVAVCCSVLQYVACVGRGWSASLCCKVLQCVAVYCSVLWCAVVS